MNHWPPVTAMRMKMTRNFRIVLYTVTLMTASAGVNQIGERLESIPCVKDAHAETIHCTAHVWCIAALPY
jgi:hypothetical protein